MIYKRYKVLKPYRRTHWSGCVWPGRMARCVGTGGHARRTGTTISLVTSGDVLGVLGGIRTWWMQAISSKEVLAFHNHCNSGVSSYLFRRNVHNAIRLPLSLVVVVDFVMLVVVVVRLPCCMLSVTLEHSVVQ